ncbi:MAG: hypothetical protein K5882_12375 [Bacteroidales bacterium]|nr:hypothetical protein [Bacteroidales bacterium]
MLLNVGDSASSYHRLAEWCALSSETLVRRTIPRNATALSEISNDLLRFFLFLRGVGYV